MDTKKNLKIATVNVNGLRAAARKDMGEWLKTCAPDLVLMQEVRAPEDIVEKLFKEMDPDTDWHLAQYPCRIKGRAGVAIASRLPLAEIRYGVNNTTDEPEVDSGRWLEVDVQTEAGKLTAVSLYAHSGEVDTEKMDQKYAHFQLLDTRMAQLIKDAKNGGPQVVVAGDFNIVHTELDIKNWKPNHNKTAGVLDEEIAHLDRWFKEQGWVDVVRALYGEKQGPYSWWSYRGRAFDNDAGWRIDYQAATPKLAAQAESFSIDKAKDSTKRFSDHAPLVVTYRI